MVGREHVLPVLVVLALAVGPGAQELPGQASIDEDPRALGGGEPFVASDHWSRDALRRLAGAGVLTPGEVATAWPLPRSRIRSLLVAAAEAEGVPGAGRMLALGYLRRFELEYPEPGDEGGLPASGRLDGGWAGDEGGRLGGTHLPLEEGGWVYEGPVPAREFRSLVLEPELELGSPWAVGVHLQGVVQAEGARADRAYGFGRAGPARIWIGRRELAAGPPTGRNVMLSGGVPFDGLGVELAEHVRLPGVLAHLGPVHGTTLLARMERSGDVERPWFWAARLSFAPRDNLVVGLNRATIFGGEGNEPVNLRNVTLMLLGLTDTRWKSSDFENQVASVDFLWRPWTEPVPLLVHGEWGFADVGGAWFRVPGIVAGVEIPVVPRVSSLALGLEHASFSGHGRGHPPWYRHGPLGEGWTDRGRLLGHPLGGHGNEWVGHMSLDPPSLPAGGTARLFRRERGEENLLVREGPETSIGGELRLDVRGDRRLGLGVEVGWESVRPRGDGEGWRRWSARMVAGVGF